jgi:hypothetical protein
MPHRNERCRPSRPPPTGPPKLRAEESVPQDLTVIGVHCLDTYIGAVNVTLDLPAEALARLQSEAIRRGITVDQLVTDLANSLPTDDPLEAFIGSGSSGRDDLARRHREIRSEQTAGLPERDL